MPRVGVRGVLPLTVVLLGGCAVLGGSRDGRAAPEGERLVSWREEVEFTKLETVQVGDHLVGVFEYDGTARFPNGETATLHAAGTLDYRGDQRPYEGYVLYSFTDGSTQFARIQGVITEVTDDGSNRQQGTLIFLSGSGRYRGISGTGSFAAHQVEPIAKGGLKLVDVEARYRVPK